MGGRTIAASHGQVRTRPGAGVIGAASQAALNEARNWDARTCGSFTTTIGKVGWGFKFLETDSPNNRSRVSKHSKPESAAASSSRPLTRAPQPRAFAVCAGIPNSASSPLNCRGMFTSSSHMRRIQQFGSGFQDFRNSFMGKWTVAVLDFRGTHPFGQAGENQRR